MNPFHLEASHLRHLNHELALLVEQIDQCCSGTVDLMERRQLEYSASLAHDLLDKMVLAEQASLAGRGVDAIVAALETRFRESEGWIAGVRDRLERLVVAARANGEDDSQDADPMSGGGSFDRG